MGFRLRFGCSNRCRVFKRVDVAKDKQIDFQEFQNALHHVGIYVDTNIERECFEEMDRDKSGTLNMDEFIISLRVRHLTSFIHEA